MQKINKPKLIIDPLLGIIDITDVLPLIDVLPFQSLGFKYQLGLTSMIFPAATHTRKQHSLGAYERTRRLTRDWIQYGFINRGEAFALQVYALYHDIGHGPFSHVTERLGKVDHDARGLKMVQELKGVIESVGCDFSLVHDFFARKNSLYLAIFDKNLGMEKLDYLERDALHTIGENPGVEYVAKHVYYINHKVMIDEVALDQAMDIQDFYIKLSKNVYLRKKSAILQRIIEKMTYFLMEEGLGEEELFNLTDFGLLGRFEISSHPRVKFYYKRFKGGIIPKLTLEFKYKTSASSADLTHKPMKIESLEDDVFDRIMASPSINDVALLTKLEDDIAHLTGIPEDRLVVIPLFSKKRFDPQDINVYSREGTISLLSDRYPSHFQAMKEYGRSHLSLRIGTYEKYRKKLYDQADVVKKYFLDLSRG